MESTVRSRKYRGQMVVVAGCRCPDIGGRRCAVMISGVAGVARCVQRRCPDICSLAACGDNGGCSLYHSSGPASLSCSLAVGGVRG